MSCSLIQTANQASQIIPLNGIIPLGTTIRRYGCNIRLIGDGIEIDGRMTAPASLRIIDKSEGRVVVEVILYEGRNREIRKMCESLGLDVIRLKRTQYGSIKLGMLAQGKYRELTADEVHKLMASSGAVGKKKW